MPSLTFEFRIAKCDAGHARHECVFDQRVRMSIANETRNTYTLYSFQLLQENNLFPEACAWAQLLGTLSLQEQVIVKIIGASLTTGFVYSCHGFDTWNELARQR